MKGQITGQVFIYIMVIVVVGLVFLLGYNYYNKIIIAKCGVEKATFTKTIEQYAVDFTGYNERAVRSPHAPCNYVQVCFINTTLIYSSSPSIPIGIDPVITQSIKAGVEQNIFLIDSAGIEPIGFSKNIIVNEGVLCLDRRGGEFHMRLSGDSERVTIEAN